MFCPFGIASSVILSCLWILALSKKATIHQVTTMLATSINVLFPGHNHLLSTGAHDLKPEHQRDW